MNNVLLFRGGILSWASPVGRRERAALILLLLEDYMGGKGARTSWWATPSPALGLPNSQQSSETPPYPGVTWPRPGWEPAGYVPGDVTTPSPLVPVNFPPLLMLHILEDPDI